MRSEHSGSADELSRMRWYAVQARPTRERLALQNLNNQGFEALCPMQRKARKNSQRWQSVLRPYFPGYLFVRLDLERQRWRSINGTLGVVRIVGTGSDGQARPTPLPIGLVERFVELQSADGELKFAENLNVGDAVRIVGGPFDNLCGVLEAAGDVQRVTILLDMLSQETRVRVGRHMLIAA